MLLLRKVRLMGLVNQMNCIRCIPRLNWNLLLRSIISNGWRMKFGVILIDECELFWRFADC